MTGDDLWKRRFEAVRDISALAFVVVALIWLATTVTAPRREAERWLAARGPGLEYYVEYICTDDCEAFRAGARHATDAEVADGQECPRDRTVAFYQGCLAVVAYWYDRFQAEAGAAKAGEEYRPRPSPEPWEPEFMERRRQRDEAIARAHLERLAR